MTEPTGFLAGVRVLECSLLGPAALGSHLVDFGAEVIKIESPAGDYGRQMTWPIIHEDGRHEGSGVSLLHLHVNRGKKSLVLNLKSPEAKAAFEDLVKVSDVVIEAMRPGFLDKMGLGFERLKELNPRIVMCTISGYGATGPYRNLPSHGIAYDTWAGQSVITEDEQGFSRLQDVANIGINAGPAFGAMSVIAALYRAKATGEPACMEIAQSDAAAYFDWYRIEGYYAHRQSEEFVTGNPSDNFVRRDVGVGGMYEGVRYQVYESSDGHVLFMASENQFWKNFCLGLGRQDLYEAYPGAKYADHARGNLELQAILRDIFKTKTSAEWLAFAGEHNTTIAPVNTVKNVVEDPQFQDRFTWIPKEQIGGADQLLFPLHVPGEDLPVPSTAPTLGQHTDEVLAQVTGRSPAQIAELRARGVV
jgi:crotonobetainyl-CoA:carnitine CoA-transferase CaiB-like acyl-CoA transferase